MFCSHVKRGSYLHEMLWELVEVLYGGQVLAVLWVVLQTSLETIQRRNAEVVHLAATGFAQGLQHVPQGDT